MEGPVARRTDPMAPSNALVMNVADRRGVQLVRSLAEAGVGVAIHFIARRQAIMSLVEDIWDRGGRVCAFDGEATDTDQETLLGETRSTLGEVQMVVDASNRPGFRAITKVRRASATRSLTA